MELNNNKSNILRIVSYIIVSITLVFLLNNFLNYWGDWPGVKKLYANYGWFGFEKLKNPLDGSAFTFSFIQFLFYVLSVLTIIFYVYKTPRQTLDKDSEILAKFSAYIIRSAFWAVFIIGVVDIIISFLATERLLVIVTNEKIHANLISPPFRITFVHLPLLIISLVIGYFTRTLGFIWLAILVLFAEFSIVITRFIFSYEQAFMGDLVRFWYGALFLFASSYALIHEGHVRVDVLYTNFSESRKAWTNTVGSLFLGIPLCFCIIFLGMRSKASIINSPMINFEVTQQGVQGLYVKYLMAGFLAIFALSMLIQFTSYFMKNANKIINNYKN